MLALLSQNIGKAVYSSIEEPAKLKLLEDEIIIIIIIIIIIFFVGDSACFNQRLSLFGSILKNIMFLHRWEDFS